MRSKKVNLNRPALSSKKHPFPSPSSHDTTSSSSLFDPAHHHQHTQALSKKSDDASRRVHLGPPNSSSQILPRFSRKAVADAAAWAGNISSSVLIIFVNKYLMGRKGYDFHYGEWKVSFVLLHLPWDYKKELRGRRRKKERREKDGRERGDKRAKKGKKKNSTNPLHPHSTPYLQQTPQRRPSAPCTTWPAPPRPWPSTPRREPSASACPRSTSCSSR